MSMDDLMLRQREQLRHLQNMLKSHHTDNIEGGNKSAVTQQQLNSMQAAAAAVQQQMAAQQAAVVAQAQQQQQQGQQGVGGLGIGSGGGSGGMGQLSPQGQQHHGGGIGGGQQQQQQQQQHGGRNHRPSASSVVMQQMIQQQQQRQMQQMAAAAAAQQQQQGGNLLNNPLGMNAQQQQQQQKQPQGLPNSMPRDQRLAILSGGGTGTGMNVNDLEPVPLGSGRGVGGVVGGTTTSGIGGPSSKTSPPIPTQPPSSDPVVVTSAPSTAAAEVVSRGVGGAGTGIVTNSNNAGAPSSSPPVQQQTRVVPVSISPVTNSSKGGGGTRTRDDGEVGTGGVRDAALIYTKFALESIVSSLNNGRRGSGENGGGSDGGGRVYTIRDLSTCMGAWDLNVPATSSSPSNNKRQKMEDGSTGGGGGGAGGGGGDPTDGNADTAFQFYYERSCPILLDAKEHRNPQSHPSAPLPFTVEDFGDDNNDDCNPMDGGSSDHLPVVAGAVVLTYGTDSKFTGGIGEEGVLTKAIVEFFYDKVTTATATDSSNNKTGDKTINDMVEAEEQMFARVDPVGGEESELIKAALFAVSPNFVNEPSSSNTPASSDGPSSRSSSPIGIEEERSLASLDDGEYIPTIWSGNTDRVYQYCLLGNFDDNGKECDSKRLCVAIQKKAKDDQGSGDKGPAKGVCRITLTLSPKSVLSKKKQLALESEYDSDLSQISSEVHRKIRKSLRILRPPKLTTVGGGQDEMQAPGKRRRRALRRQSVTQLIDHTMIVVGVRCKHELLLDADEVGKIYVNGTLVVDCALNNGANLCHVLSPDVLPAHTLFGVDFTLPASDLPSKAVLEREYGALLVDALIDAGQCDADVGGKLLNRLITGNTERMKDDFDLDDDESDGGEIGKKAADRYHDSLPQAQSCCSIKFDDVSHACLESIVLTSPVADPVGIGAKALGTKFRMTFGKAAFPCEIGTNEESQLHRILGAQKIATPVPRRARDVLHRGAYCSIDKMATFLWGLNGSWDGDHSDAMRAAEAMEGAIKLLRKAGCRDVKPNKIQFVARKKMEPAEYVVDDDASKCAPSISKLRCWYDSNSGSYYVSDAILFTEGEMEDEKGDATIASDTSVTVSRRSSMMSSDNDTKSEAGLKSTLVSPSMLPPINEQNEAEKETPSNDSKKTDGNDPDRTKFTPIDEGDEKKEEPEPAEGESKEDGKDEVKGNNAGIEIKASDSIEKNGDNAKMTSAKSEEKSVEDNSTNDAKGDVPKQDTSRGSDSNVNESDAVPAKPQDTPNSTSEQVPEDDASEKQQRPKPASAKDAAYLLAFYIAKEHPDVMALERFVTCNRS